jgi:uncharacterized membrane protein
MLGVEVFQKIGDGQIENIAQFAPDLWLLALIAVTLLTPLIMAIWFTPVIIISSEETALSAMKMSFNACLKNMGPFTLYGLVIFILAIIAFIPLMLGYLVLLPILSASVYVAFLDCFKSGISNDPTQLLSS